MPEPDTLPRTHQITHVDVVLTCSCGGVVVAPTESAAIGDWEAHCDTAEPDEW
jgi:hypothetical protein